MITKSHCVNAGGLQVLMDYAPWHHAVVSTWAVRMTYRAVVTTRVRTRDIVPSSRHECVRVTSCCRHHTSAYAWHRVIVTRHRARTRLIICYTYRHHTNAYMGSVRQTVSSISHPGLEVSDTHIKPWPWPLLKYISLIYFTQNILHCRLQIYMYAVTHIDLPGNIESPWGDV